MANQPKKYKKFVATAATATLVASAIVPVASAKSFSDVAENNEFQPFIDALSDAGIINGYPDGTFKPGAKLTRGQVVKMLGRWVESNGAEVPADWDSVQRFNDVPVNSADQELVKYAALVKDAGVFTGSNGNLLAGNNITRQQMAKVLNGAYTAVNGVSLVDLADNIDNKLVTDLASAQQEFEGYIQALVDLEISTVSVFRPSENVTRAQFAKFLYNTIELEAVGAAGVKAINNTTVEVTFDGEIDDVKALKFTIDGLEVKNAVVKQTDAKTAVLTTAAQEGGKEYTVSVDGEEVGSFTGITAVVPTKVELVSTSVQGKLGQQVTVQAKVTVADGQSKAGIPVTLFVPGSSDGIKAPVTVEALTDENGVATHTYTRYAATTDTITVYATGDRSKFTTGYVFWGVDTILAVTEVSEGTTINNGANKTYKITYKDPATGKAIANQTFNVGFVENLNVTSDKVANATVNGVQALQLSNNTVLDAAQITTDAKGEATFTVSGANTTVTPVVYALHSTANGASSKTYVPSALQATAPKVTFAAIQAEYTIELTRDGGEVAATGYENGRTYKVLVKDKDGKVAANEVVNVALNEDLDGIIATDSKKSKFVVRDADGEQIAYKTANSGKQISVKTNAKGEASFVISSDDQNDYATPVAWIDINTAYAVEGKLDQGEPKTVGQISYFTNEYLDGASLVSYKGAKKSTKFEGTEVATFKTALTNQSGKPFGSYTTLEKVSYTVFNTGANDVVVYDQNGANPQIVSPNRSYTVTYTNGADLQVHAKENKSTSVRVVATGVADYNGKDFAFTAKEVNATFTSTTAVADTYTGKVAAVTTSGLTFEGKAVEAFSATTKFFGGNGSEVFGAQNFVNEIQTLAANGTKAVTVTLIKDTNGNKTFKVVSAAAGTSPVTSPVTSNEIYVTKVDVTPNASTLTVNDTVAVTLTFSENVSGFGVSDTISFDDGTNAVSLAYDSATANSVTFKATLVAGPNLNNATLDLSGITSTLTGAKPVTLNLAGATNGTVSKNFDLTTPVAAANLKAHASDVVLNNGTVKLPAATNGEIKITTPFTDFEKQDIQDGATPGKGQVWIGSVIKAPTGATKAVYTVTGAPDKNRTNVEQTVGAESEFKDSIIQFLPLNKEGQGASGFTANFVITWKDADDKVISVETFDFVYAPAN